MIRRAATGLVLALGLTIAGPALAASAVPVATIGPVATKACAAAPEPTSPFAGLSGKLYGEPATASDTQTRPPGAAWRTALPSRLATSWRASASSPEYDTSAAMSLTMVTSRASASTWVLRAHSVTISSK